MKLRLFVTLLTSAVLLSAHAQAGETQSDMPQQNTNAQPQEQHVIPSPNPTIDDSKTPVIRPGKVTGTKVQPAAATHAAPLKKKATRHKRKRKSRQ